jgi:hypothetical protein
MMAKELSNALVPKREQRVRKRLKGKGIESDVWEAWGN